MSANSAGMVNFRTNVVAILHADNIKIAALLEKMNEARKKRKEEDRVSQTFLSNLLNGHKPCQIPFAEEVAEALGVSLVELLSKPQKKSKQHA